MIRATRFLAAAAAIPLLAQAPLAPAPRPVPQQTFRLESGLACVLVENHERPLIRMVLVDRWNPQELPPGKVGLAGFLAMAMAAGGAGSYSRAGFRRALDELGMAYGFEARIGCFRWSLVTDSRSQETAMELLASAVARPEFDGPLAEGMRQSLIKRAAVTTLREQAVTRFLWNVQDPGTLMPAGGAAVERIEFQDLLDFRRRVIRPETATLFLYGDLNLAQARQLALMHLGIWGPAAQPPVAAAPPRPGPKAAPEPRLLAVFEPGPGAGLWAGAPRPERGSSPAAEALLPILLARTARACFEDRRMSFRLDPGVNGQGARSLVIQATVPAAGRDRLVEGFLAGLDRLRRTGFSTDDLVRALAQWKAENAALPLHPAALLGRLAEGRLDPELARAVSQVTVKELDQALNAWLEPGRVRYLLLGADAPLLQSAEKAGLGPSAILRPD